MHRTLGSSIAALLLIVLAATAAMAQVPDPTNSSVGACFAVCPAGDLAFDVVVRDFAHNPVVGANVVISLKNRPAVNLCPTQEPGTAIGVSPTEGIAASRFTGLGGLASFHLRAGGLCPGAMIQVFADAVPMGTRAVGSTDQDGNLVVDAADHALALAEVGGANPGSDLNCDHSVSAQDIALLDAHLGHTCDSSTPALPRSWGRLKMLYW